MIKPIITIGIVPLVMASCRTGTNQALSLPNNLDGTYHIEPPALNGSNDMYLVINGNILEWHDLSTGTQTIEKCVIRRLEESMGYEYQNGKDRLPMQIQLIDNQLYIDNGIDATALLIPSELPAL